MDNNLNKNRFLLIIFFILIWGIMLVKTIVVSTNEPESFFSPFYVIMLDSTWQSHFNVDLFLFSMVFAVWAIYREKSLFVGFTVGIFSILFGGVFSFLYLIICAFRARGNLYLLLNGKKAHLN